MRRFCSSSPVVLLCFLMGHFAAGCTNEGASRAGEAAGQSVVLAIVAFTLVVVFTVLSLRYGAALRKRKRLGGWLAGGGHALAIACAVSLASTQIGALRIALGLLGAVVLLAGHVGVWIVVLGCAPASRASHPTSASSATRAPRCTPCLRES